MNEYQVMDEWQRAFHPLQTQLSAMLSNINQQSSQLDLYKPVEIDPQWAARAAELLDTLKETGEKMQARLEQIETLNSEIQELKESI